jgi:hypothetical protein
VTAPRLLAVRRRLRVRRVMAVAAFAAIGALAAGSVAARIGGMPLVVAAVTIVAILAIIVAIPAARVIDSAVVARRLDAAVPELEDSSDLLLRDPASLSMLQGLQRERVRERLAKITDSVIDAPWPWRRLALVGVLAALVAVAAGQWPPQVPIDAESPRAVDSVTAHPGMSTLLATRIDVEPPTYTALAARAEATLDIEAPVRSRLRWMLRLDTSPREVVLAFHDGNRLALVREGDAWTATRDLDASILYRIELVDAPPLADAGLHRLEAIADRPPEIRVIEPERTLTTLDARQAAWDLVAEASDDYALGEARLSIALAQGSGEQVTVKQQEVALRASPGGDARARRYRQRLDLAALGFAQGDDLIVRFMVSDTRSPSPNVARSASFILRWPAQAAAEAEGIDGIVQKVLPAYFRSQRQIIIDTESLLAERASLDAATFVSRSDAIGVDQKILRLRYGQFLGEESESGAGPKPTTPAKDDHDDADGHEGSKATVAPAEGHSEGDGHDHAPGEFGNAGGVVAEYGHTHDHAEAATLLDPETKRILKAALAEMWQAELHLRTGEPRLALPFENRALGFIKQVQQASRIYLARVGLELPPVDEGRRLSGERKDLRDRRSALGPATRDDTALLGFQRALDVGSEPDAAAFSAWLRDNERSVPDALAVFAALDEWQRDRACGACRERLLDRLWTLMPAVAPGAHLRRAPDASGEAYLDAMRDGGSR